MPLDHKNGGHTNQTAISEQLLRISIISRSARTENDHLREQIKDFNNKAADQVSETQRPPEGHNTPALQADLDRTKAEADALVDLMKVNDILVKRRRREQDRMIKGYQRDTDERQEFIDELLDTVKEQDAIINKTNKELESARAEITDLLNQRADLRSRLDDLEAEKNDQADTCTLLYSEALGRGVQQQPQQHSLRFRVPYYPKDLEVTFRFTPPARSHCLLYNLTVTLTVFSQGFRIVLRLLMVFPLV
ncbi:hypothetical protein FQN55_008258 [Onygenales sp. PD_40]|nr:hypothetical protein FQN55_008258 [Onygenales sp. PD_40]